MDGADAACHRCDAHADCVMRSLVVALPAGSASLELLPNGNDCEFDASAAMLVGDPL